MEAKRIDINGRSWIAISLDKQPEISSALKKIPRTHWSEVYKAWMVLDTPKNKSRLREIFGLPPRQPSRYEAEIGRFRSYLQAQRYSDNTIRSYCEALMIFLTHHPDKLPEEISDSDAEKFFQSYAYAGKKSISWQRLIINAIKLYYSRFAERKIRVENLVRPKKDKKLPNVLSKEEVEKILRALKNQKHVAMLSLIYCCGLRRSELLNLRPADIDSGRKVLWIRNAKGRKDRIAPLPEIMIILLREYYKKYRPKVFLFEGQKAGERYSEKSINEVFHQAVAKSKISKPATLHWLRHSYATHLLEKGTGIRYIQELLGHKSSKTTEIYTHVSTSKLNEIRSPFEDLDLK